MKGLKEIIKQTPIIGEFVQRTSFHLRRGAEKPFPGSAAFWESRYRAGGHSGVGSYGFFAEFKAEVLNKFVEQKKVHSVIEFGCGDGHQLTLAKYAKYLGFDVSATAISLCKGRFVSDRSKVFKTMNEYNGEKADLTISLDVIYHLVEDEIFNEYMRTLFEASNRYVIIYSSNAEDSSTLGKHVRHRKFTHWIESNLSSWKLMEHVPNRYPYHGNYRKGSFADFFFYEAKLNLSAAY
jgi:SAM-dependent methyltransferase